MLQRSVIKQKTDPNVASSNVGSFLDQLKGPKNKGGLRFRQLDTHKKNENSQTKKGFNIKDVNSSTHNLVPTVLSYP